MTRIRNTFGQIPYTNYKNYNTHHEDICVSAWPSFAYLPLASHPTQPLSPSCHWTIHNKHKSNESPSRACVDGDPEAWRGWVSAGFGSGFTSRLRVKGRWDRQRAMVGAQAGYQHVYFFCRHCVIVKLRFWRIRLLQVHS